LKASLYTIAVPIRLEFEAGGVDVFRLTRPSVNLRVKTILAKAEK